MKTPCVNDTNGDGDCGRRMCTHCYPEGYQPKPWKWRVRCYYNDTVEPPRTPGELAIETKHRTDSSKDLEVTVGRQRPDIGKVEVWKY